MSKKVDLKNVKPGLKLKLFLSLSAIAVSLLVSSIISVMQYQRMSNYVSGLIAENVRNIDLTQDLEAMLSTYNLDVLAVIGVDSLTQIPSFDKDRFYTECDQLRSALKSENLADSVVTAYTKYMTVSKDLPSVILSNFIDSRTWYFETLQPEYNKLRDHIDLLAAEIYQDLADNSETFDRGLFRSIIPGIVAVGVGLLLILMLFFFMMAYYVTPIYRMLESLTNYSSFNKKYNYSFDGDDQLSELNDGISSLAAENQQLRKRISDLKR